MHRRSFLTLLGGAAAAWPLGAGAQQQSMPVIGYLRGGSRAGTGAIEAGFRQGLGTQGFEEGRNVVIAYRTADSRYDQLPEFADGLVRRGVTVIYAGDNTSAVAAKAATKVIPIVFRSGGDPVQLGLVASLNRPDGNLTGVAFLSTATEAIRLQMLHEAVPNTVNFGLLTNPRAANSELNVLEAQGAARKLGVRLDVVRASTVQELDVALASLIEERTQALVIDGDSFFSNRRLQIAAFTARHGIPAIYPSREFPDVGGLMSYGASNIDADRLAGVYVGRILKGQKPSDLPVQQSTRVELILNLITAKSLGITFPITLLGRADEVIE